MKGTLPLFGLLILAGCGPDVGPASPDDQVKVLANELGKPADLLPLNSGNAWTYTMRTVERNQQGQARQSNATPTLKVSGMNGDKATIAFLNEKKLVSEVSFTRTEHGVVQNGLKAAGQSGRTFSPPLPLYHWPMKVGEKKEWSGTGFRSGLGDNGSMTSTLEYKGESEVDTPAGRMKAHRFDSLTKYKQNSKEYGSTTSIWLVPKVGIVRNLEIVIGPKTMRESELKLQSFTVK
jgi:hypothetical protein